jgi:hypothetical protein
MSSLLLQINLDLQANSAINILNTIESSVDKIVGKLQQFSQFFNSNPINVIQPKQIGIANDLLNAVKEIDKSGSFINSKNIEEMAARKQILDNVIKQSVELQKTVENMKLLNKGLEKQRDFNKQLDKFYIEANKFQIDYNDTLKDILSGKINELKLAKSQQKEFNNFVKSLSLAVKYEGDYLKKLGMTVDEARKLHEAITDVNVETIKQISIWDRVVSAFMGFLNLLPTAGILIATLKDPLSVIKDSLSEMHDLWKTNNKVSNNFLINASEGSKDLSKTLFKTMQDISTAGGGMRKDFAELGIDLGKNIITLDQTKEAVNAVLASSSKGIIENNKQLGIYSSLVAQTSRATGVSASAIADLTLKYSMLSKEIGGVKDPNVRMRQSAVLTDVLVNVTGKYQFSVDETSHVVSLLNRNMMFLNKNYKVSAELAKLGITPASSYAVTLSALGDAAKKMGHDSKTAMDAFSSAIEDPLNNVLLLGSAINSTDPGKQMLEMGKNAAKWSAMIEKNPLLRGQARQMFGKSYEELKAMADANTKLTETSKLNADGTVDLIALNKEMADSSKAAEAKTTAQNNANNKLTEALDKLRIMFGNIANGMQPFIDALTWLVSLPFAPYIIAGVGALTALGGAAIIAQKSFSFFKDGIMSVVDNVKGMVGWLKGGSSSIGKLGESMKTAGESSKSLTAASKGGGGLKEFAGGIKDFINTLGEIKIGNALKAAAAIAIIGAGLAIGVYALNKASEGMTPAQAAGLLVTVGGITAVTYILSKMGNIGPNALIGAALVGGVGLALALSVAALNIASQGITLEQIGMLGIMVGGLLVTMGILALMTSLAAPALLGAIAVGAVGLALALGVGSLGLASQLLDRNKMELLGIMTAGLMVSMLAFAGISFIAAPAVVGAIAVSAVGVALAVGIAALGLASKLIDPDIGDKFKNLASGIAHLALTSVTGPLALIGAIAIAAAAPLLALSLVTLGAATSLFGESVVNAIVSLSAAVASIPAGSGPALISMAAGLTAFAASLAGGAIFSFFSGGMVNNAKEMGTAMQTLLGPITQLGSVGDQVAKSFVSIADGLKVFVNAINDSSGWFSSFESKAEKVAAAMRKISEPMKDMRGVSIGSEVPAEEIKKSLALTIESSNKSNQEMVNELKEIKKLLSDKSDDSVGDKMDQSVDILKKILNEMVFSSGFGATSANADYNA